MQVPFEILEYRHYDPEIAKQQEVYEYRIYIGSNKPNLFSREIIIWHNNAQSLRHWIWEGFKLQPWRYEDNDLKKLPQEKWTANKLWNLRNIPKQQPGYCKYEIDEDWDTKLVTLLENESYRSHAEVILKAIEFITSVFTNKAIANKYGFDWI